MSITLTGSTDIRFRDTSFRWISSQYFTLHEGASDAALLSRMNAHPVHADGYIGGNFGRSGHHGLCRIACIAPSDYLTLDASAAIAWLDEFRELVTIRRDPPELTLLVLGID